MRKRLFMAAAAASLTLGMGISPLHADGHDTCGVDVSTASPAGTVSGKITTIGWLAGVRWGHSVLTLENGEEYRFKIAGAKALETGVAENRFEGEVYNLDKVGDFAGTYYGAATNITLGTVSKGEGVVNNAHCVVVKYRTSGAGLKVSGPAPGGVEISFID